MSSPYETIEEMETFLCTNPIEKKKHICYILKILCTIILLYIII